MANLVQSEIGPTKTVYPIKRRRRFLLSMFCHFFPRKIITIVTIVFFA